MINSGRKITIHCSTVAWASLTPNIYHQSASHKNPKANFPRCQRINQCSKESGLSPKLIYPNQFLQSIIILLWMATKNSRTKNNISFLPPGRGRCLRTEIVFRFNIIVVETPLIIRTYSINILILTSLKPISNKSAIIQIVSTAAASRTPNNRI